jgi:pimeloyl-ACP methyl ester carboxylesterase
VRTPPRAGIVARVTRPSTFILIHGAWHGAWCWQRLIPLLEASGARVIAPDLPSMGDDRTPAEDVTLDSWARFVAGLAAREPGCRLVGHSRAGAIISRAAELAPDHIGRLVYLSAYLLRAGDSVAAEARRDTESLIAANMIPARGGVTCGLRPEVLREAFYGDCTAEDAALAAARVSPEPLKPLVTPLRISDQAFGSVARHYIETTRDRAVSLGAQRRMQAALPCASTSTLDAGHSPFLSQPAALARMLISI